MCIPGEGKYKIMLQTHDIYKVAGSLYSNEMMLTGDKIVSIIFENRWNISNRKLTTSLLNAKTTNRKLNPQNNTLKTKEMKPTNDSDTGASER